MNRGHSPWNLDAFPVSGWVAFLPGAECPRAGTIETALARALGEAPEIRGAENRDSAQDGMQWAFAAALPTLGVEVVVWVEPAIRDAFDGEPELQARLGGGAWVLRMQAVLGREDPAGDHFALTRLLATIAPEAPAILDASSDVIFDRGLLESTHLGESARSLERMLWSLDAALVEERDGGCSATIRTKGLARAHRPELEMAGVPTTHLEAALTLLQTTAALLLESEPPVPMASIEVGDALEVHLVPSGSFARVCERAPAGADGGDGWTWPRQAIERIESGCAALLVTRRTALALREQARQSFPDFATAWGALRRCDDASLRELCSRAFHVLAPVDPGGGSDCPEFGWFRVIGFDGAMIRAALLEPAHPRDAPRPGAERLFSSELVRGWRVDLGERRFGPDDSAALLAEIDRLRGVA